MWHYQKDVPNDTKFKTKITGRAPVNGSTKDVEILVPLKYLSNFSRIFEMPLINSEINLMLTWTAYCLLTISTAEGNFICNNKSLHSYTTTTTIEIINCNKYQSKVSTRAQNQLLDSLVDRSLQGVKRFFILLFENSIKNSSTHTIFPPKSTNKNIILPYLVTLGYLNYFLELLPSVGLLKSFTLLLLLVFSFE